MSRLTIFSLNQRWRQKIVGLGIRTTGSESNPPNSTTLHLDAPRTSNSNVQESRYEHGLLSLSDS